MNARSVTNSEYMAAAPERAARGRPDALRGSSRGCSDFAIWSWAEPVRGGLESSMASAWVAVGETAQLRIECRTAASLPESRSVEVIGTNCADLRDAITSLAVSLSSGQGQSEKHVAACMSSAVSSGPIETDMSKWSTSPADRNGSAGVGAPAEERLVAAEGEDVVA